MGKKHVRVEYLACEGKTGLHVWVELVPEEISFEVKAGEGYAATEAARGICCHSYRLNKEGLVEKADIVAPTTCNAYNIEKDLREFVSDLIDLPEEELTLKREAYDPCFFCSVHSLIFTAGASAALGNVPGTCSFLILNLSQRQNKQENPKS